MIKTITLQDSQIWLAQTHKDSRDAYPAQDPGAWYDRRRYVASLLNDALREPSLAEDARSYLERELEAALNTGD